MHIVWVLICVAVTAYVAWWLIYALRKRILFEVEMALGVSTLWIAFATMNCDLAELVPWPAGLSLAGWAVLCLSMALFPMAILSLHRGGRPTSGWEHTTQLTTGGVHGLVRHPMQLSGILAACSAVLVKPTLAVLLASVVSMTCFALAARAEDRVNLAKFGEPYRIYLKRVPALNLLAGIWGRLRSHKES
jgi:protein-S-isoprenylcysteine O-methyltransferase Ste14